MTPKAKILVVDDEASIRKTLSGILEDEGFDVMIAADGPQAIKQIEKELPDVVLLDIWMPGMDGLSVLTQVKKRFPGLQFIIMSGHGTIDTAVKATKLGAFDFIEKPLSVDKVMIVVNNLLDLNRLRSENSELLSRVKKDIRLVGESPKMQQLRDLIARVAPTNSWVLITGENGTGKELVAQNVHFLSARASRAFVEVNCAAIPEDLIESELFGHEKGAFTGAANQKKGKFDLAHGGTIFLDEIGDMSLKTQAKVLRILQEQKFERVGGSETIYVDVRVIAATNKDLEKEIREGRFREDLYYRLNVIPFRVPSLRERKMDVPILAKTFMDEFLRGAGGQSKQFTPEALALMSRYEWPGNVRELRNLVERLFVLIPGQLIDVLDLEQAGLMISSFPPIAPGSSDSIGEIMNLSLRDARAQFEKEYIIKKLEENEGNISKTAENIGVERSHLHRKIKIFGIDV